jgi:hypothetical protein
MVMRDRDEVGLLLLIAYLKGVRVKDLAFRFNPEAVVLEVAYRHCAQSEHIKAKDGSDRKTCRQVSK